jgi:replicative DNA helicase
VTYLDDINALARANTNGHSSDGIPGWVLLIVDGKTWLTSGPDHPDALWGDNQMILAVKGQPTTIAGPQGAGKSVFGQRLALGRLALVPDILGIPITPGDRNVLYLASDRPEQARLSMRRMVTDNHLDTLEARMRIWKGPPPEDVAKQPLMLRQMAEAADADLIVIDSAKDVALKLSADEVGAAYNSALQHCVAHDIEVIALHHPRKLSGETRDNPVRVLDDLYGAYWITAGNGSVIYLQPGDFDTYTLTQLKSPVGHKAEIPYEHVIDTGDVRPPSALNLTGILEQAGDDGCSGAHIACCLYKTSDPTGAQKKAVLRALNELAEEGVAERVGKTRNTKWRLTE